MDYNFVKFNKRENISEKAKEIGISRQALWAKTKGYKIKYKPKMTFRKKMIEMGFIKKDLS